jgi:hypothetical protein
LDPYRFGPSGDLSVTARLDTMDAPLLVLTGITVSLAGRGRLRRFLRCKTRVPVYMPLLPWAFGLRGAAAWLRVYLRLCGLRRVNVLAYIGGGFVLRVMAARDMPLDLQRIVYDRGPVQEAVPALLLRRFGRLGLVLAGRAAVVGLADVTWLARLPLPRGAQGTGLLIETGASVLARRLGLSGACYPDPAQLMPGAQVVLSLPLSHDDVYEAEAFLLPALRFLETGHPSPADPTEGTSHD